MSKPTGLPDPGELARLPRRAIAGYVGWCAGRLMDGSGDTSENEKSAATAHRAIMRTLHFAAGGALDSAETVRQLERLRAHVHPDDTHLLTLAMDYVATAVLHALDRADSRPAGELADAAHKALLAIETGFETLGNGFMLQFQADARLEFDACLLDFGAADDTGPLPPPDRD